MSGKNNSLKNKWNVFKENNPTSHICVMLVVVNVLFILFSAILISFLPENEGHTIPEMLRLAFTLMVNPSGKYIYSEAPISLIITTIVVLLGMISLTGGTVGFITSVIQGFIEKTANSKRTLHLKNHIVILNYNNKVPSIIYDYCFDDVNNTFITILAREDKKKIIDEIDNMYDLKGTKKKFKNIIVREGNPMSKMDLDKINLKDARTVILMTPAGDELKNISDEMSFEVSKLFMFVSWYFSELKQKYKANIVVETSDSKMEKMVKEYHGDNSKEQISVPVNYKEITGKMLAITAIMPSVNDVMKQFFSFEGVEIYIEDKPANLSIEEELKVNRSVIPLFDQGDKRVYVAENEEELNKSIGSYTLKKQLPKNILEPKITFEKTEIIIVGTNSKLHYILESLKCFKNEYDNDVLHVILADTAEQEETLKKYYADEKYNDILEPDKYSYIIIEDIYNPMNELGELASNKADSIIFLSDDQVSEAHIDEKPLIYWTNLKRSIRENKNVDIIVEILDAQNQSIIELKNKDQIIVSDDFLGHLYAQLGKNPARLDVIKDMITSNGDSGSLNVNQELQDEGDFVCATVSEFFKSVDVDLSFESKRELILWVYEATGHKVIPVGVVKDSVSYIFARTDGNNDGLDSTVLLGIEEGQIFNENGGKIVLNPEDELVMFMV